jgi:hypothetical protein
MADDASVQVQLAAGSKRHEMAATLGVDEQYAVA